MSTVLRSASCPVGKQCPEVESVEEGYEIVGTNIPDPRLPEHERRVRVPHTMLPELGGLEIADFEAWLEARRTSPGDMLRVQTRAAYAVPSDDEDFAGYLDGAPEPLSTHREPFFDELREDVARDRIWRNLVVLDGEPTSYQRYANEWVYTYAVAAGQVVRVLDLDRHPSARVLLRTGDFWAVEHQYVAVVRYAEDGHHQGEVAVEDTSATGYIAAGELAWDLATPFTEWYADHPEYQRRTLVA
ncbi:MAG: hypothetical protein L0I76_25140 [Pseudonocardia sp.]|nr:hypothetical protein [Pseudonocardia sp.]